MSSKSKLLITGATGFIGNRLIDYASKDYSIRCAIRKSGSIDGFVVGNIGPDTDWSEALENIDIVIHLAARVHVMNDTAIDPLTEFRKVNTIATLNFAKQAAKQGVKRFVYLSSIKVNGEVTRKGMPFTEEDDFIPSDPYARSKYEAEQGLLSLANEVDMDVVIIRPPLVYGPNVKANFFNMMKWLYKCVPLPLGAIKNKRSLIALDNLVSFILTCCKHPAASNQVFLVSDNFDMSTTELLEKVSSKMSKKSYLVKIKQEYLELFLRLLGKRSLSQRLCSSLQLDISKAKRLLGWSPSVSVDEALTETVARFKEKL